MGPDNKTILFAVLNWGLGHATRSIPLIRALSQHNRVILATSGRALELLRNEFPDHEWIDFPDYGSQYSKFGFLVIPYLGLQIPVILFRLVKERRRTRQIVREYGIELIISDSRFGVYAPDILSYFITHQLRFPLPKLLRWMTPVSEWYNRYFFNRYNKVFVVDSREEPSLSGELSHRGKIAHHHSLVYIGALSSITQNYAEEDIDLLVSISGPETARTTFEKIILKQIRNISGKKVVVLGKPGEHVPFEGSEDLQIFPHLPRDEMSRMMNRARVIVCRSGYSTVMELVALKKKALMIPTPGQTEQEYLAKYYLENGYFQIAFQKDLDLKKEIEVLRNSNNHQAPDTPVNNTEKFLKYLSITE